jgi:putative addiction module component (TIGR02574 family)
LNLVNARTLKVLEEALDLSVDERRELARELVESLAADASPSVRDAWTKVISRRAREVLDGTAATRDLDESLDEIEASTRPANE